MSQLLLITDFDLPPDQVLYYQRLFTSLFLLFFSLRFVFYFYVVCCCWLLLLLHFMESKNFDVYNHES